MTERTVTIEGAAFGDYTTGLADSATYDIDPADTAENAIEIVSIAHTGDCDVKLILDAGGSESTITLDSLTGESVSQGNDIIVSEQSATAVRIENTSGGPIDVAVTGWEVSR